MKNLDEIKFEEGKRRQAGMTVPEGFFEQFQQQLEAKIDTLEAVKPAPVVEMPKRTHRLLSRWAVAACCLLVIGIGAIVSFNHTSDEVAPAVATETAEAASTQSEDESEMEEMIIRSVNDFELYDYYCDL